MTVKDCGGHKGCECDRHRFRRKLCGGLLALVLLVLFVVLVVWLVLRPHKPRFYLQDLSVLCLNVTPPASTYLFTTMQATVAARNANGRVGVYYDEADVYAQYKGVAITVPTRLPVGYQGRGDQSVWSPFLQSVGSVQLSPQLAVALAQDETAGYVLVDVRVDGWVRWKVGSWISGRYHLRVNCPALLTVNEGKGSYGANTGGGTGAQQQLLRSGRPALQKDAAKWLSGWLCAGTCMIDYCTPPPPPAGQVVFNSICAPLRAGAI